MKTTTQYLVLLLMSSILFSCSKTSPDPEPNHLLLKFHHTFLDQTIVLGDADSETATEHTSHAGQVHRFSEVKYVISSIRLVKSDGSTMPYHINDLDVGAFVIDLSRPETWEIYLQDIPGGTYQQILFGLGIPADFNVLNQEQFPKFYAKASAHDTRMMWEWGTGYRFLKIEGFYGPDNLPLSIHTGSTVEGTEDEPDTYTPGVDAYRDIALSFPIGAEVAGSTPQVIIRADFDHLLSGDAFKIYLSEENATPNIHTAVNMKQFVDNVGGNGTTNKQGMFSIEQVIN